VQRDRIRPSAYELTLLAIVAVVFVWSGINPHDRFTWFLEVFPVILGIPALVCLSPFPLWKSPLAGSRWLPFVVICFCLAFSAFYELIEFWTAVATGEAAEA
jgi:putative membrane protein